MGEEIAPEFSDDGDDPTTEYLSSQWPVEHGYRGFRSFRQFLFALWILLVGIILLRSCGQPTRFAREAGDLRHEPSTVSRFVFLVRTVEFDAVY